MSPKTTGIFEASVVWVPDVSFFFANMSHFTSRAKQQVYKLFAGLDIVSSRLYIFDTDTLWNCLSIFSYCLSWLLVAKSTIGVNSFAVWNDVSASRVWSKSDTNNTNVNYTCKSIDFNSSLSQIFTMTYALSRQAGLHVGLAVTN